MTRRPACLIPTPPSRPGADFRRSEAKQPAREVHVDQTVKSGPQRVRDLLPAEAKRLLKGRVQIINLWRPIRGPVRDAPLAVCDARSVAPEDLMPSDLIYRDRVGETYSVLEPTHSSAPRYAGQNKVNPMAVMLSAVMMLRHLEETAAADAMEKAIANVIALGDNVTYDLKEKRDDPTAVGTSQVADAVIAQLKAKAA